MTIIALLISLLIWGFIFWLCWWALRTIAPPEPFYKGIVILLVIASIVVVIGLLTGGIAPFPFLAGLIRV